MPRSRRISTADLDAEEEEETTPRRRRRVEEDEDEQPRRRTRAVKEDDDDDEEVPVSRRRRTRAEPERGDEDEDDDADGTVIPISRGRKEIKRDRPVGEGGDSFFRWDDEPQVIKFLDNEPWAYNQHWVTRAGKQSFPCIGRKCPLCEIGVKVGQRVVYPIVNLSKDGTTQTLEVGVQLEETLAAYDSDKKTGPLDRLFWALSRTEGARRSGRARYNYVFTPIKDRDLEEDYDINIDEAEGFIDEAEIPTTKQVLGNWTEASLREIADEVMEH